MDILIKMFMRKIQINNYMLIIRLDISMKM